MAVPILQPQSMALTRDLIDPVLTDSHFILTFLMICCVQQSKGTHALRFHLNSIQRSNQAYFQDVTIPFNIND